MTEFIASAPPGTVGGVVGMPGTGKTRALQEAADAGAFGERYAVFDPVALVDRRAWNMGIRERRPWEGELLSVRDVLDNPRVLDRSPLRAVVTQSSLNEKTIGRDFSAFVKVVWSTGRINLIGEEIGMYGREASYLVNRIASAGAHCSMAFWAAAQSLGRFQKDMRRNLSRLVVYAQAEDDDIKSLGKRCGRAFADKVQRLVVGDAPLCWRLGDRT